MIEIHGVTQRQCELLDKMWSIDGYDEYMQWKESLPANTRKQVAVLEEMVLAAELDAEMEVSEEVSDMISDISKKGNDE